MVNVGFGLHFGWAWLRLVEKVLWQETIQFCVRVGFGLHLGWAWLRLVEKVLWQDTIQFCVRLRRQVLRLTWQRLIVAYQLERQVDQFMREYEACLARRLRWT